MKENTFNDWPERIYLQRSEDDPTTFRKADLEETLWSPDQQFDFDVPYIRADLAAQAAQPCRDDVLTPMLLLNAAACIENPELADAKKKDSIIGKLIEAIRALRTQPAPEAGKQRLNVERGPKAVPSVPAQAVTDNLFWSQDVVNWNRAQAKPPIKIGMEMYVAEEVRRLLSGSAKTGEAG